MNLTRLAVKFHAATFILVCLIFIFGFIAVRSLPNQLIPDIEQPEISITTAWKGAAPEEMERVIIEPIENAVKNTPGVLKTTSSIKNGSGKITLLFDIDANLQSSMIDVINSLNQAPPLPLDAIEPVVTVDKGPNVASLMIKTLPGNSEHDLGQYQKLIEDVVKTRFSQIPGIAFVNLESLRSRELRITFDPYQLAALNLSLKDLQRTVISATDVSAGTANVGKRQYTVRFAGQFEAKDAGELIIGYSGGTPIYLKDVATVTPTLVDRKEFYIRNGQPSFYFTLRRQPEANTVALMDEINRVIRELNSEELAQHGLAIDLSFDSSVHIRNAIALVKNNLGLGVLMALGILWFFLRGIRDTLIIAATIPVSLMASFIVLSLLDRTLNVISLAALAFAVGLVLDAAIIVQENIARLVQGGMESRRAILRGTLEVSAALFSSAATTVCIFLPILYMSGLEGQIFYDLALTLSVAVIASFLCAITLIPVINKFLPPQKVGNDPLENYWNRLTDMVMRVTNSQAKRYMWISGILVGSSIIVLTMMPKTDFLPRAPIDGFFMNLNMSPGGNVDYIEQEVAEMVRIRLAPYLSGEKEPKIKSYNFVSYNAATTLGYIYSADPKRVEELMGVVKNEVMFDLPDTKVALYRGSMISVSGGGSGRSVDVDISGPDLNTLITAAQVGVGKIHEAMPELSVNTRPSLGLAEPELRLIPNDQRISQAGLTREELANTIKAYTGGLFIGEYFDGNERTNIVLRGQNWLTPEQLGALPLYSPRSGIQTIGELTVITRQSGPTELRRIDGRKTITISITPPKEVALEEVISQIKAGIVPVIEQHLDKQSTIIMSGNANKMAAAIEDMIKNFVLAIVVLLVLLTAMFKSVKDAILVLLVMPLSLAGGVLGLAALNLFTFQSLDLLTMIGFITLLGLVVNNAILLVDQARAGERHGMSLEEAVRQAVRLRAKPVYMSTLTSLFGMLPLMIMPGVGSEIYRGLAAVVVGGMAVSTVFTLVLFPALLQTKFTIPWLESSLARLQPKLNSDYLGK